MSYGETAVDSNEKDDDEKKVYMTLTLEDYPFLKNMKIGQNGKATIEFDLDSISKNSATLCINNFKTGAGKRV